MRSGSGASRCASTWSARRSMSSSSGGATLLRSRRVRTGAQPVRTGAAQRRMVEDAVEVRAADCNGRDAASRRGGGIILVTTNRGGAWSARSSGTTAWLQSVTFTDAKHGWAVGASSSNRDFGGVLVVWVGEDRSLGWAQSPCAGAQEHNRLYVALAMAKSYGRRSPYDLSCGDRTRVHVRRCRCR